MAWKRVANYWLGYSVPRKQFILYYKFFEERQVHQIEPSAQEFSALVDMFRNEAPISFNTDGGYFVSGAELPEHISD